MPVLSLQDFVHGVDFTGINPATGGDHNNLVDLSAPKSDSSATGKGLVLWTIDSALGVPRVPDPTTLGYDKWMRYLWLRRPVAGDPDVTPKLYAWNDDSLPDATYLNWIQIVSDTTGLQAQITAIVNQLAAIQSTAVNAINIAGQAKQIATDANTTSQNALTQVQGAVNTANAAKTAADNATAAVATLTTDLNTLQQIVSTIQTTNIPTLTNLIRSWAVLAETAAANTDLAQLANGENARSINTKFYDPQNLITLSAGQIQFNVLGTYRVRARVCYTCLVGVGDANAGSPVSVQAAIIQTSDNAKVGLGQSSTNSTSGIGGNNFHQTATGFSEVDCIFVASALNKTLKISLFSANTYGYNGIAVNRLASEVYTLVDIQQLA